MHENAMKRSQNISVFIVFTVQRFMMLMSPQCEAYVLHLIASPWSLVGWSVQGDVSWVLIHIQQECVDDSCSSPQQGVCQVHWVSSQWACW